MAPINANDLPIKIDSQDRNRLSDKIGKHFSGTRSGNLFQGEPFLVQVVALAFPYRLGESLFVCFVCVFFRVRRVCFPYICCFFLIYIYIYIYIYSYNTAIYSHIWA